MTNAEMKSNRFLTWARCRKLERIVVDNTQMGRTVCIQTGFKVLKFTKKNLDCLRVTKSGVYVPRGKGWDCILDRSVSPSRIWAEA